MTPSQFIIWFRGFVEAANTFNITPKQWDSICEHLEKVKLIDEKEPERWSRYTLDNNNWNVNTTNNIK